MALAIFTSAIFLANRASMSSGLVSSAHSLAGQISAICAPQAASSGACIYTSPQPGCSALPADNAAQAGWFCEWNSISQAPEHVQDTILAITDMDIRRVYVSADRSANSVTVRVDGCHSNRWLGFGQMCGAAERSSHI